MVHTMYTRTCLVAVLSTLYYQGTIAADNSTCEERPEAKFNATDSQGLTINGRENAWILNTGLEKDSSSNGTQWFWLTTDGTAPEPLQNNETTKTCLATWIPNVDLWSQGQIQRDDGNCDQIVSKECQKAIFYQASKNVNSKDSYEQGCEEIMGLLKTLPKECESLQIDENDSFGNEVLGDANQTCSPWWWWDWEPESQSKIQAVDVYDNLMKRVYVSLVLNLWYQTEPQEGNDDAFVGSISSQLVCLSNKNVTEGSKKQENSTQQTPPASGRPAGSDKKGSSGRALVEGAGHGMLLALVTALGAVVLV
jgi:hypothetical protein